MEDGETDLGIPAIRSPELRLGTPLSPLGRVISLRSSSDSMTVTLEIMAQCDIHYLFCTSCVFLPPGSEFVKIRVVTANLEANYDPSATINTKFFWFLFSV